MNRLRLWPAIVLATSLVSSCSTMGIHARSVSISSGAFYTLQLPRFGPRFTALQKVVLFSPGGQREEFLVAIENDSTSSRLALLDFFYRTLLTLRLDDTGVKTSARVPLARRLDPSRILALIQLVYWPKNIVSQGLDKGERLIEKTSGREVWNYDKIILQIKREGEHLPFRKIFIKSPGEGWRLVITTLVQ